MAVKSISIRIEEEMLKKLAFVAEYEGRSVNSQVLCLVRESIRRFEAQNGTIQSPIPPEDVVKLPRKKDDSGD